MNNEKTITRNGNHIYFNSDITMNSITCLFGLIRKYETEYNEISSMSVILIAVPKPLYIHITCVSGGDLFAGYMGYDYIKNSNMPIYTVSEGCCVSAGAILFMAGIKRFMTENSYILFHQIKKTFEGSFTYREICDEKQNSDNVMQKIYNIILMNVKHTENTKHLTRENLETQLSHDNYMDYMYCLDHGLIDSMYTNDSSRNIKDLSDYIKKQTKN